MATPQGSGVQSAASPPPTATLAVTETDAKSNLLSQDLLVYISLMEQEFNDIEDSDEKTIILEWLLLILQQPNDGVAEARTRNMALRQLLFDIENNKLRFPFNERPSRRAHAELIAWLLDTLNQNSSLENENAGEVIPKKEPINQELSLTNDFENVMSTDNRTYVAVQTLPNNGGVFGYIAITIGDSEETQWLNSKGCPIVTPVPSSSNLVVQQNVVDHYCEALGLELTDITKVWHVLKKRRPLSLRNDAFEFYKMLYENVQQEMLPVNTCKSCTHQYINKLLKYIEMELKSNGVTDLKQFSRLKMLSMLKKKIKAVISDMESRTDALESATKISTITPIISMPPKCCYNFVSSTLWNEISQQRPGTKYMDILSYEYPQYFFPKYFAVLVQQKKQILISIAGKYCKILDEMFFDLEKSIMTSMKKYKDAKWEWHLAHEIIDAYNKEKNIKDSLCAIENSVDENTDSFVTVILNEMEMAQEKLKFLVNKNDQMAEQIRELRIEIGDREQIYKTISTRFEEKMDRFKKEINIEKRDIMRRESTIAELQRTIQDQC